MIAAVTLSLLACPAASATHRPVSERGKQLVDSFGAAPTSSLSAARPMSEKAAPRSETCPDARRGLTWYRARARSWEQRTGYGIHLRPIEPKVKVVITCSKARRAAKWWHAKAAANRLKYERWYLYAWRDWMPPFWKCIARWEESYDFSYRSSVYTSVFAITIAEYDADAAHEGAPPWRVRHTPRDQYRAALGHQARFGLSGWGSLGRCQ